MVTKIPQQISAGDLGGLLQASQALWDEASFKGVLKRFAALLYERLEVKACGFIAYKSNTECSPPEIKMAPGKLKVPGVPALGLGELQEVRELLTKNPAARSACGEGFTVITVAGQCFGATFVGDCDHRGTFVVWPQPKPLAATEQVVLDFLTRQVQAEAGWFRRLDQTQAMLYQDDLTGLYNYRYFELSIEAELRRSERFLTTFCLLFIDLDNFKTINDTHGHMTGSSCLKQVAEIIREQVREIDIPIRYGGDEFVVLLLGANSSQGLNVAERVRAAIAGHTFQAASGEAGRLTASIGVAAYPEHGQSKEKLLSLADETMYKSKRAGKNRVTMVKKPLTPATTSAKETNS